jgi:HSP20 family molecular chaperone IbpA
MHPSARPRNTKRQRNASAVTRSSRRKCIVLGDLTDCLLQAYEFVARRAYEKFLNRGASPGSELEDWLSAERELLQPIAIDLEESEEYVRALAAAPCFTAEQVDVSVEPRWLAILASSNSADGCPSARAFCILQLPAEVVPERSVAVLADGLLGIRMPKAGTVHFHSPKKSLERSAP